MDDMRLVGVAHDYAELHEIFRKVAELRQMSREQIDHVAGFPSGYASKVLAPIPKKFFGPVSLDLLLGTLGLVIAIMEDPQAVARVSRKGLRIQEERVRARAHKTMHVVASNRMRQLLLKNLGGWVGKNGAEARWRHKRQGKSSEKRTEDA